MSSPSSVSEGILSIRFHRAYAGTLLIRPSKPLLALLTMGDSVRPSDSSPQCRIYYYYYYYYYYLLLLFVLSCPPCARLVYGYALTIRTLARTHGAERTAVRAHTVQHEPGQATCRAALHASHKRDERRARTSSRSILHTQHTSHAVRTYAAYAQATHTTSAHVLRTRTTHATHRVRVGQPRSQAVSATHCRVACSPSRGMLLHTQLAHSATRCARMHDAHAPATHVASTHACRTHSPHVAFTGTLARRSQARTPQAYPRKPRAAALSLH